MGLNGRLEELGLPDVFQILHLSKKSGRLVLTRREGAGMIIFREGQIIYAASDSVRDTLGNILVSQKALTEEQLTAGLEEHYTGAEGKRLGTILVERGWITQEVLERAVRQQIERVIHEFLTWETGFFRFDPLELADEGEVTVDVQDFLLRHGVNPENILLDGLKLLGERRKAGGSRPAPEAAAPAKGGSPGVNLTSLKRLLLEMRSPAFTGEVSLMILRYAAQHLRRGVLLMVRRDALTGLSQFGLSLPEGSPDERIRDLRIPLDGPSVFKDVVESQASFVGSLPRKKPNEQFLKQIGGLIPVDALVVPMLVNGRVAVVLYGDNAPDARPVGPPDSLEVLMAQAGLAMEKNLLERKIEAAPPAR
ncbi:MAG TPA: DUF4388 domain-containing protein [Candidatus Methylomirabilis sp.]|jgi:hypothetical protein|nr:DUF4388 domain-containing protein [Candidatus Methylomirabilis sp.]